MTHLSLFAAALLLVLPAAAQEAEGPSGTACARSAAEQERCVETRGHRFSLATGGAGGDLVWTRADGTEIAAGAITAPAVDLRGPEWRRIALRLDLEDPARAQKVTIRVQRGRGGPEIAIELPRASAQKLVALYLPAAEATISFATEGHHAVTRAVPLDVRSAGTVHLLAIPYIAGVVVRAGSGEPVAGATVAARTGDAELTTATDPLGRFHLEIVSSWPDRLRIDATGLASRHLSLPKAHKSYDAGTIPLQRGGQLVVTVADPDEALTADLLTKENRKWTTIATARLENGVITFDRIESGDYRLLLRGGEPLQRVTTAVEVRDGDTTRETIELERARLTIVVKQRGSRVPRTDVVVMPAEQDWSSSVVAGGETDPEFELWQSGEFLAFVGEGPGGTIARQLLPAQSEVVWNIDLPAHRVSGIVLDASAKPLAQASVTLVTAHADEGTTATTTTDAAGQFVFDAVPHGQQRLRAAAPNHLPGEHHFALAASDPDYHTTLRLRKSAAIRIAVADAASRPLAEALVTDGQSISTRTDAAGEATIDLAPAEQKQIYIVPLSGSFASTTIRADGDPRTDPVRIEVPPGSATLRVTAMDQDKKPLANVYIAIRADGLMIPPNIRTAMRNHRGDPVATGPDGVAVLANFPSGVYELWPYFNRSELTAIVNGSVAPAATVLAQPGTNVVTFTFDRTSARDFLPAPKAAALPPHSEIQLQLP